MRCWCVPPPQMAKSCIVLAKSWHWFPNRSATTTHPWAVRCSQFSVEPKSRFTRSTERARSTAQAAMLMSSHSNTRPSAEVDNLAEFPRKTSPVSCCSGFSWCPQPLGPFTARVRCIPAGLGRRGIHEKGKCLSLGGVMYELWLLREVATGHVDESSFKRWCGLTSIRWHRPRKDPRRDALRQSRGCQAKPPLLRASITAVDRSAVANTCTAQAGKAASRCARNLRETHRLLTLDGASPVVGRRNKTAAHFPKNDHEKG